MKKRIVLVALIAICLVAPVFAANNYSGVAKKNSVGVGLNLGTNTGVGLRYGMGDFDILANIGLDVFKLNPLTLSGDVAASYNVYTIDGGKNLKFPITVGAGANVGLKFGKDKLGFDLSVLVPVGIEYTFADVPITLYLRLAPGVNLFNNSDFGFKFGFAGYIGALWNF